MVNFMGAQMGGKVSPKKVQHDIKMSWRDIVKHVE